MVAPVVYRSDDASAPALSGTSGSLITLLDACLVNGYGVKPAAGWTKAFSGTNGAAYRMGTGGTARRMYLRVVDDQNNQYASIRGFDDMTDVNTGTEPFPTVAQFAGTNNDGMWFMKSTTANATARPWVLFATPTCFFLISAADQTVIGSFGDNSGGMFFGEYVRNNPAFTHNVCIIGKTANTTSLGEALASLPLPDGLASQIGHFLCRGYVGGPGAMQFCKRVHMPNRMSTGSPNVLGRATNDLPAPDPVTGKVYASRIDLCNFDGGAWGWIGRLPGVWAPHVNGFLGAAFNTINGSGGMAGRTYMCMDVPGNGITGSNGNVRGRMLFDLTDFD